MEYLSIKAFTTESYLLFYSKINGNKTFTKDNVVFDDLTFENTRITFYSNLNILFKGSISDNLYDIIDTIIDSKLYVGSDEVGVGESIGPIVACALKFKDYTSKKKVIMNGIKDSKKFDAIEIKKKSDFIKKHSEYYFVILEPKKFNEIYKKVKNVKAINALLQNELHKKFEGRGMQHITDQFVNKNKYNEYIRNSSNKPFDGELMLLTKAEEKYLEVAAAAIISKDIFNDWVLTKLKDDKVNYKMKKRLNSWEIYTKISSGEFAVKDKSLYIKEWKK